jgi:hypothetical protein
LSRILSTRNLFHDGVFGRNNYDSNAVSGGLALSF